MDQSNGTQRGMKRKQPQNASDDETNNNSDTNTSNNNRNPHLRLTNPTTNTSTQDDPMVTIDEINNQNDKNDKSDKSDKNDKNDNTIPTNDKKTIQSTTKSADIIMALKYIDALPDSDHKITLKNVLLNPTESSNYLIEPILALVRSHQPIIKDTLNPMIVTQLGLRLEGKGNVLRTNNRTIDSSMQYLQQAQESITLRQQLLKNLTTIQSKLPSGVANTLEQKMQHLINGSDDEDGNGSTSEDGNNNNDCDDDTKNDNDDITTDNQDNTHTTTMNILDNITDIQIDPNKENIDIHLDQKEENKDEKLFNTSNKSANQLSSTATATAPTISTEDRMTAISNFLSSLTTLQKSLQSPVLNISSSSSTSSSSLSSSQSNPLSPSSTSSSLSSLFNSTNIITPTNINDLSNEQIVQILSRHPLITHFLDPNASILSPVTSDTVFHPDQLRDIPDIVPDDLEEDFNQPLKSFPRVYIRGLSFFDNHVWPRLRTLLYHADLLPTMTGNLSTALNYDIYGNPPTNEAENNIDIMNINKNNKNKFSNAHNTLWLQLQAQLKWRQLWLKHVDLYDKPPYSSLAYANPYHPYQMAAQLLENSILQDFIVPRKQRIYALSHINAQPSVSEGLITQPQQFNNDNIITNQQNNYSNEPTLTPYPSLSQSQLSKMINLYNFTALPAFPSPIPYDDSFTYSQHISYMNAYYEGELKKLLDRKHQREYQFAKANGILSPQARRQLQEEMQLEADAVTRVNPIFIVNELAEMLQHHYTRISDLTVYFNTDIKPPEGSMALNRNVFADIDFNHLFVHCNMLGLRLLVRDQTRQLPLEDDDLANMNNNNNNDGGNTNNMNTNADNSQQQPQQSQQQQAKPTIGNYFKTEVLMYEYIDEVHTINKPTPTPTDPNHTTPVTIIEHKIYPSWVNESMVSRRFKSNIMPLPSQSPIFRQDPVTGMPVNITATDYDRMLPKELLHTFHTEGKKPLKQTPRKQHEHAKLLADAIGKESVAITGPRKDSQSHWDVQLVRWFREFPQGTMLLKNPTLSSLSTGTSTHINKGKIGSSEGNYGIGEPITFHTTSYRCIRQLADHQENIRNYIQNFSNYAKNNIPRVSFGPQNDQDNNMMGDGITTATTSTNTIFNDPLSKPLPTIGLVKSQPQEFIHNLPVDISGVNIPVGNNLYEVLSTIASNNSCYSTTVVDLNPDNYFKTIHPRNALVDKSTYKHIQDNINNSMLGSDFGALVSPKNPSKLSSQQRLMSQLSSRPKPRSDVDQQAHVTVEDSSFESSVAYFTQNLTHNSTNDPYNPSQSNQNNLNGGIIPLSSTQQQKILLAPFHITTLINQKTNLSQMPITFLLASLQHPRLYKPITLYLPCIDSRGTKLAVPQYRLNRTTTTKHVLEHLYSKPHLHESNYYQIQSKSIPQPYSRDGVINKKKLTNKKDDDYHLRVVNINSTYTPKTVPPTLLYSENVFNNQNMSLLLLHNNRNINYNYLNLHSIESYNDDRVGFGRSFLDAYERFFNQFGTKLYDPDTNSLQLDESGNPTYKRVSYQGSTLIYEEVVKVDNDSTNMMADDNNNNNNNNNSPSNNTINVTTNTNNNDSTITNSNDSSNNNNSTAVLVPTNPKNKKGSKKSDANSNPASSNTPASSVDPQKQALVDAVFEYPARLHRDIRNNPQPNVSNFHLLYYAFHLDDLFSHSHHSLDFPNELATYIEEINRNNHTGGYLGANGGNTGKIGSSSVVANVSTKSSKISTAAQDAILSQFLINDNNNTNSSVLTNISSSLDDRFKLPPYQQHGSSFNPPVYANGYMQPKRKLLPLTLAEVYNSTNSTTTPTHTSKKQNERQSYIDNNFYTGYTLSRYCQGKYVHYYNNYQLPSSSSSLYLPIFAPNCATGVQSFVTRPYTQQLELYQHTQQLEEFYKNNKHLTTFNSTTTTPTIPSTQSNVNTITQPGTIVTNPTNTITNTAQTNLLQPKVTDPPSLHDNQLVLFNHQHTHLPVNIGTKTAIFMDIATLLHDYHQLALHEVPARALGVIRAIYCERLHLDPNIYFVQGALPSLQDLLLGHGYQLVEEILNWPYNELFSLESFTEHDVDTYSAQVKVNEFTALSSLVALGGALAMCRDIVFGKAKNGFAITRPPGHHTNSHELSGFCVFGHVATVAKYATKVLGVQRVLIFDWDIHYGNGTSEICRNDPNIVVVNVHSSDTYPFLTENSSGSSSGGGNSNNNNSSNNANSNSTTATGLGPNPLNATNQYRNNVSNIEDKLYPGIHNGIGTNIDVNVFQKNNDEITCGDYLYLFDNIMLPILREFSPQLIIVSAGFDAARGDTLGTFGLSPECYSHMISQCMLHANGKVMACLEGGYNVHSISMASLACIKALSNHHHELPPLRPSLPSQSIVHAVQHTISKNKTFWRSFGVSTQASVSTAIQQVQQHVVIERGLPY